MKSKPKCRNYRNLYVPNGSRHYLLRSRRGQAALPREHEATTHR
jgi:hypothetical protein